MQAEDLTCSWLLLSSMDWVLVECQLELCSALYECKKSKHGPHPEGLYRWIMENDTDLWIWISWPQRNKRGRQHTAGIKKGFKNLGGTLEWTVEFKWRWRLGGEGRLGLLRGRSEKREAACVQCGLRMWTRSCLHENGEYVCSFKSMSCISSLINRITANRVKQLLFFLISFQPTAYGTM